MIYRAKNNPTEVYFCIFDRDTPQINVANLVRACAFKRSRSGVFFCFQGINLDFYDLQEGIVISNWAVQSEFGWLAISKASQRIGFIVGEREDYYKLYLLTDSQSIFCGNIMEIRKKDTERLPVGFSFLCRGKTETFLEL